MATKSIAVAIALATIALPATVRAAQPATAGRCSEMPPGAAVEPPPNLYSAGGALDVDMDYVTSLARDGRTLFCFRTAGGLQSPTLHVRPGETLNLTLHNRVPALPAGSPARVMSGRHNTCGSALMTGTSVNIHFHGTNTSPTCGADEVVHTLVGSGETFHYHLKFPADEPSGLYWYHPHVHGIAEAAVQGGASALIVVDGIERAQPELAGLPERLLIVRDQLVSGDADPGGVVPAWDLSLNGVPVTYPSFRPATMRMPARRRELWRVANASADTVLDLQLLYDGHVQDLEMVALDSVSIGSMDRNRHGYPMQMSHILLPPGGRAEFVVPCAPPGTKRAQFRTVKVETGPDGDNDPTRTLAEISFGDGAAAALPMVPAATEAAAPQRFAGLEHAVVTAHRTLYFSEVISDPDNPASPTNFFITVEGATPKLFDADDPPSITTTKGAVEDWTIENRSGEVHEFHLHQVHFQVLQPDGTKMPWDERQFRDTVQVPFWSGRGPYPSVHLRVDFRGMVVGDYVYHCHILGHEDAGMMATIRVLPAP